MILSQQFSANATKNLARGAVRYLGKEMNYGELRTWIARLSYLYMHDLGTGARVAFVARNCTAYVATFFALSNTRSVTIPIDPDRTPEEIIQALKDPKRPMSPSRATW